MFLYFLQELKEYCLNGKYIKSGCCWFGYWPDIANKANETIKEIEESYKINLNNTKYSLQYMQDCGTKLFELRLVQQKN